VVCDDLVSEYRSARFIHSPDTTSSRVSSLAPARSTWRRSVPRVANRQVWTTPSAERRARVQSAQNGWVTEAMMSSHQTRGGSARLSGVGEIAARPTVAVVGDHALQSADLSFTAIVRS